MWAPSAARGLLILACAASAVAAAVDPSAMDRADDGRPAAGMAPLDGRRRLNQKQKKKLAAAGDGQMNAAAGRFGAIADATNKKTKQEMRQEARAEKKEEGVNERKQKKKRKRKKRGSGKSGKAKTHAPSVPATHAPTRGKSGKEGTLSPTVHVTKAPSGAKAEKGGAKSEKEFTSFPTVSSSEFPTISSPTTRAPTALPTSAPSPAPSPSPTRKPVVGPTPPPTLSPTNEPSSSPTKNPTPAPSPEPTMATPKPTDAPTSAPSSSPTLKPVVGPTPPPTGNPSSSPTKSPTPAPSPEPTTMQPTSAPSSSPTLKPVVDPTPPPTPAPTPEPTEVELSCPDTLDRFIIEPEAILHYAVVEPVPAGASNGIFCGRLEVTGQLGWLGFAISEDDKMAGSTAVIGEYAEGTVLKYDLKQMRQVVPAPEERQTLRDTSISQEDGRTVMTFTKLLVEGEDVPLVLGAKNIFLHARGDGSLGYHGPNNRWDFEVNLGETAPPTPEPTTRSPSKSPSDSPTDIPTFYPTSATIAPTLLHPSAIYFTGFEKGFLADYDEWTTSGNTDDVWRVSIRNAASGKYSVRAPDLGNNNTEKTPGNSTLTFTTNASWGAGTLQFSILGGAQMPIDIVDFFVDGELRDIGGLKWTEKTEFEPEEVVLSPGQHVVEWVYKYNPIPVPPESFPPDGADKRAGVFLDDVCFVPFVPPPPGPTPSPGPTTIAPTSVPDGATYFIDFEQGSYPELGLDREDDGTESWFLSNEKSETGLFSLRSPDLYNEEGASVSANFTFNTGPDWPAGTVHFFSLAGNWRPLDVVTFFVDGIQRMAQEGESTEFVEKTTPLGPGAHELKWEITFNPGGLPAENLPPPEVFPDRTSYFVDRLFFVPLSADATNPAPSPDSAGTEMPTYWPTFSPTLAPTEADLMMP
ncbi:hypothetical protein ACHAXT_013016 [Thalassiosira profunda]